MSPQFHVNKPDHTGKVDSLTGRWGRFSGRSQISQSRITGLLGVFEWKWQMNEYILLMHGDAADRAAADDGEKWGRYLATLRASGQFDGGSAIGPGQRLKLNQPAGPAETRVTGFIQVRAESLEAAKRFLEGNPVYEAGGTVELRELPRD